METVTRYGPVISQEAWDRVREGVKIFPLEARRLVADLVFTNKSTGLYRTRYVCENGWCIAAALVVATTGRTSISSTPSVVEVIDHLKYADLVQSRDRQEYSKLHLWLQTLINLNDVGAFATPGAARAALLPEEG